MMLNLLLPAETKQAINNRTLHANKIYLDSTGTLTNNENFHILSQEKEVFYAMIKEQCQIMWWMFPSWVGPVPFLIGQLTHAKMKTILGPSSSPIMGQHGPCCPMGDIYIISRHAIMDQNWTSIGPMLGWCWPSFDPLKCVSRVVIWILFTEKEMLSKFLLCHYLKY